MDDAATDVAAARPRKISLSPDNTVEAALRTAISTGLAMMRGEEPAALAGEVEPLHQFRVATRRLRTAVELFAPFMHAARVKMYRRDLRFIGNTAGAVRECDVIAQLIRAQAVKLDPQFSGALEPCYEAIAQSRAAAHQTFADMIGSKRYNRMVERISNPLVRKNGINNHVRECAPAMLVPMVQGVMRTGERLDEDAPVALFHRMRIRVKRMRYALEMFSAFGSKRHKKAMARLAEMQELLGTHHDLVTAALHLRTFADTEGVAAPTLLATGAMIDSLGKRQRKVAARCVKRWKKAERSDIIRKAAAEIMHFSRVKPPLPVEPMVNAS